MTAVNAKYKKDGDKLFNVQAPGNRTIQIYAASPFDAREAAAKYLGILPKHSHRLKAELAEGVPNIPMEL